MTHKLMTLAAVMTAAVSYAMPDPFAWFDMKDVSGTTVRDASGNGHNLSLGPTVR